MEIKEDFEDLKTNMVVEMREEIRKQTHLFNTSIPPREGHKGDLLAGEQED